jgi:hypothetical protein
MNRKGVIIQYEDEEIAEPETEEALSGLQNPFRGPFRLSEREGGNMAQHGELAWPE